MPIRKKMILLVDDEESILLAESQYLRFAGFLPVMAKNADEALEIARREPVRLILADVMMPGKSGFDLLCELREDPATKHIPVVMITALRSASDEKTARGYGAADVLVKPIEGKQLQEVAKRFLGPAMEES